ncbi:MAG: GAF domain-containing protein [Thermoplasmata archaeon]|nr:GAF domain-containing protein [Thermoplasmata archaeon]MCK5397934.1 GAF domain-containing protein [Thermoplasmata archaeon]
MPDYEGTLKLANKLINSEAQRDDVLGAICFLLKDEVKNYDWVGIYFANNKTKKLQLGPFAGDPTEHVKIDYGQGICGQAAESLDTFVIQDISQEDNYLSCSPTVKSEIVIPIMKNEKFVAQLDIDSHAKNPFTEDDTEFLEELCRMLAELF